LYEVASGRPVDATSVEEANAFVLSGNYGFPTGSRQAVQLPSGLAGEIDAAQVGAIVQSGGRFIGDDGLADYGRQKQRGGDGRVICGSPLAQAAIEPARPVQPSRPAPAIMPSWANAASSRVKPPREFLLEEDQIDAQQEEIEEQQRTIEEQQDEIDE